MTGWLAMALGVGWGATVLWAARRSRELRARLGRADADLAAAREREREIKDRALAERQTIFNSMIEGVLVLDREGRVVLLNRSCEEQFNLTTDVRNRTLPEAIRSAELIALVDRLKSEGPVVTGSLELPGNPPRHFEVNAATVLDRERQPAGMVVVLHDVTRLRVLESVRSDFVANVSHELRTPLSIIRGGVETLLDGARNDPVASERFLQSIERHTIRLSHLLDDLLTLSSLESGVVALKPRLIEVRSFVEAVLGELSVRASARRIRIQNTTPEGLTIWADSERIEQVLVNLLDNAIKYGREGGEVSVAGVLRPEGPVELVVRDDGPGVPAEACERIFERFYRVDKGRSRETGGTGLGLSIVKHIIQTHGGDVWCVSGTGRGAAFHFTLPSREPASGDTEIMVKGTVPRGAGSRPNVADPVEGAGLI